MTRFLLKCGIGFYSLIAATFVFARRFSKLGRRAWAWWSIVTGVAFFISFAAIASGSLAASVMFAFYAAVTWIWIWHSAVSVSLLKEAVQ